MENKKIYVKIIKIFDVWNKAPVLRPELKLEARLELELARAATTATPPAPPPALLLYRLPWRLGLGSEIFLPG